MCPAPVAAKATSLYEPANGDGRYDFAAAAMTWALMPKRGFALDRSERVEKVSWFFEKLLEVPEQPCVAFDANEARRHEACGLDFIADCLDPVDEGLPEFRAVARPPEQPCHAARGFSDACAVSADRTAPQNAHRRSTPSTTPTAPSDATSCDLAALSR